MGERRFVADMHVRVTRSEEGVIALYVDLRSILVCGSDTCGVTPNFLFLISPCSSRASARSLQEMLS